MADNSQNVSPAQSQNDMTLCDSALSQTPSDSVQDHTIPSRPEDEPASSIQDHTIPSESDDEPASSAPAAHDQTLVSPDESSLSAQPVTQAVSQHSDTLMPQDDHEGPTAQQHSQGGVRTQLQSSGQTAAPMSAMLDHTLAPPSEADTVPPGAPPGRGQAKDPHAAQTRPAAPPSVGAGVPSVAGYTVLKELGRGGMGVVYKAKQPGLNRMVALKMILGRAKGSKKERDLFRVEAEVIAKLQHPNIVQIFEIGEHDGAPFFSLEFVEGGCLADHIAKELPPPRVAARIVQALAAGMDMAHSQGILHRDLKPANVLLAGKPEAPLEQLVPKITDFGLAKQIEEGARDKQQTGGIMGTPSYMPPEQAEGRNWQLGPPADIYALGAVLYDLLVGTPPFRGKTHIETLQLVVSTPPRPPRELSPKIPHDLSVICLKCLEKEPANRYRSARELGEDLGAFLNGEPIKARPYGTLERTKMWTRRKPAAAALALLSVLGLLALGTGGIVIARQQTKLAEQQTELAREEEEKREIAEKREKEAEENARKEETLRKAEERERARAEANFKEARDAVDVLSKLGHKRLSAIPNLESVRRELLEKALQSTERFLTINGDHPSQRFEVGRAQLRAGEIQEMLGRQKQAEKAYLQARDRFAALVQAEPKMPEYRQRLARAWNDLAVLQQAMNQPVEAVSSFSEALKIKTALAAEDTAKEEYRLELATSHNNRGILRLASKQPKDAEQDFKDAQRLLSGLTSEEGLQELARTHNNLGTVWTSQTPAQAAAAFEQALECWTALHKRSPAEPSYRHEIATAYSNRGLLRALQTKVMEAEADYQQAMEMLVKLTSEFRGAVSHRELLGNVSLNYGQLLRELNRPRDAEKIWRASLPLWRRLLEDVPGRQVYRQKLAISCDELAIALAMTNRLTEVEPLWEEAIGIEEKLVAESPKNAVYWQDLTNSLGNLISVLRVKPLTGALEKTSRQLVDVQERRNKEFPGIAAIESGLAEAQFLLADALLKRSKPAEARAPMAAAVRHQKSALAREPKQPAHEQQLRTYAMALVDAELREGRHAEAKKALDELLAALPPARKNPVRLTGEQAALVLVRCMTAAKSDTKAAASYADAAMVMLRSAAADGFRDGKALAAKDEWQPLRERDDFKQLLKQLDQKP